MCASSNFDSSMPENFKGSSVKDTMHFKHESLATGRTMLEVKFQVSDSLKHALTYHMDQLWWQGWCCDESTCLPPMWPGFDLRTRCQMWIEFVGSLLCYERFSPGYCGFPLSPKTNI